MYKKCTKFLKNVQGSNYPECTKINKMYKIKQNVQKLNFLHFCTFCKKRVHNN